MYLYVYISPWEILIQCFLPSLHLVFISRNMLSWVQRNADGAQQVLEVGPTLSSASVLFIIDTLNTYSPSSKITDLGRLNTLQKAGETK